MKFAKNEKEWEQHSELTPTASPAGLDDVLEH